MRSLALALITLSLMRPASAAPVPPPVRAEIDALIGALQTASCQFNRNGSWHSAAEAKTHLLRKLDYLEKKNLVQSTEQFIERGASTSSSSGKSYLVKCGNADPVDSKTWLGGQLKIIRSSAAKAPG